MVKKNYKFRGGLWVGWSANSWPNGILEIGLNTLILRDEMLGKEFIFSKNEISEIKIKKFFPVIGYGIRIYHRNKNYNKKIFFWYWSFRFNKLINALKKLGWLK